jgi:hypothetical protein
MVVSRSIEIDANPLREEEMRIARYLTTFAGLLFVALLANAVPAQAEDLCPSDESVLKSSKSDPPFQCAVHNWSSKKSISAWDTKSWSSDTALGYEVKSKCAYRSSGDVSWTWAAAGPSYSATFTNWADGTRHFGTGVIFTTGGVDDDQIKSDSGCANGDGKITNSITKLTDKVTIDSVDGSKYWGNTLTIHGSVSPSSATGYVGLLLYGEPITSNGQPIAGPIVDGKFTVQWKTTKNAPTGPVVLTAAYPGDTANCPAAAKSCGWTGGQSQNVQFTMNKSYSTNPVDDLSAAYSSEAPESSALLSNSAFVSPGTVSEASASSVTDPKVTVKTASAKMPGKLGLRCPEGSFPLHTDVYGASSTVIEQGKRGSRIKAGKVHSGRVAIQIACRKGGSVADFGRVAFGTQTADKMATHKKGGVLFAGPGADRLNVKAKNGTAFGGNGADRIVVGAANGVAAGGPGADVIQSRTAGRTLLIGGSGRDRIVAGGKARVNARDGERDRITCRGGSVRVKADRHDQLSRNCRRA